MRADDPTGWGGGNAPLERRLASTLTRLDKERRALEGFQRLGTADLRLLWLFADGRARTLRDVAGELGLEQSTVNRQVNAAVGAGLLERTRRPGGTAYDINRTADGRRTYDEVSRFSMGVYATALDAMGDDAAEELVVLLQDFLGHFQSALASSDGGR
ncbi:MarR family winged helix-turn-helix transcriptional regulator [Dietzia alimentaria]|uniref:MarR family winged helix-turn-helix transcriptional regulator n=1 Tax=Dietzia alimentaria TaxID=665550 RepID=UPI000299F4B9|nr:MarR family winged helix-turn-helix transcriptional regulator [Dietzia alimentaria]